MEIEALKKVLRESEAGEDVSYRKLSGEVSPQTINKILSELSGDNSVEITEDMNGHDMDWSCDLTFEDMEFDVWGSVYSGSFMFEKQEL